MLVGNFISGSSAGAMSDGHLQYKMHLCAKTLVFSTMNTRSHSVGSFNNKERSSTRVHDGISLANYNQYNDEISFHRNNYGHTKFVAIDVVDRF